MSDDTFHVDLRAQEDFIWVADPAHSTAVSDDWLVAMRNVRNSTGAIEEGRDEEVNVVDGSLIAATLNVVGLYSVRRSFPAGCSKERTAALVWPTPG